MEWNRCYNFIIIFLIRVNDIEIILFVGVLRAPMICVRRSEHLLARNNTIYHDYAPPEYYRVFSDK